MCAIPLRSYPCRLDLSNNNPAKTNIGQHDFMDDYTEVFTGFIKKFLYLGLGGFLLTLYPLYVRHVIRGTGPDDIMEVRGGIIGV